MGPIHVAAARKPVKNEMARKQEKKKEDNRELFRLAILWGTALIGVSAAACNKNLRDWAWNRLPTKDDVALTFFATLFLCAFAVIIPMRRHTGY